MRQLKILHINTEMGWRGGENQMRYVIEGSTHSHHIVCRENSRIHERLPGCSTPLKIRNAIDPIAVYKIVKLVKTKSIDLLDCQTAHAHSLGLLVKAICGVKLVVHRRVDYAPKGLFNHWKYQSLAIDTYVAISKTIANILEQAGVSPQKIVVVPSAVDPLPFQTHHRDETVLRHFGLNPDIPTLINAAACTEQKRQDILLEALALLNRKNAPPFQCVIAGDGHLRASLEKQAAKLGLTNVRFLGWVTPIENLLAQADIFVLSSDYEGLGTCILEAIHSGLVVVATDAGGVREMIVHGKTGYLSPITDPEKLADNLFHCLTNRDQWGPLKAAAKKRIDENFSLESMIRGNDQVYQSVMNLP